MIQGMAKQRQTRKASRRVEWAVVVRLADGRALYWCGEEAVRQGQNWGPHHRQAHRFTSRDEAERYAAICETPVSAQAYEAVPLPTVC